MKSIRLTDVYTQQVESMVATVFLYELLAERDPVTNISHREMPSFDAHRTFVDSRPYKAWYIVFLDDEPIGATYLSNENEIGIFIKRAHQGHGYGKQAIYLLMKMHPAKRFLANIAPGNSRSLAMFEKLGFELVQFTFAKEK